MATRQVTVRGAGIFGLSIAWALLRRGASVRVTDIARVGAGASGGIVGAMAPHVPEGWNDKKAFQLDSLLMAEGWWAAVQAAGGVSPGYARLGRLQPLADDAAVEVAQRRAAGAAQLWQGRAEWRVIRARGDGWEPHSPSGWLVDDTLTARIAPRSALAALVAAIRARGGEVLEQTGGEDATGPVVWATGVAGLEALSQDLGQPVGGGQKGQAARFGLSLPDAPQIFADGLHLVPHANGTVAVGSTTERDGTGTGTDARLDALVAQARALCPALADAPVVDRWAGFRPRAVTRAPLLGPWPGRPAHYVANGGFKIGFGIAPGVAEAMADLVLDGRNRIRPAFLPEALLARR
ncbi:MAG: NAD(P)/FAD-dependent oxidoreductase [Gemmobacter sp.]